MSATVSLTQLPSGNPYARLNGAWDRRMPYTEAIKIWRRISGGDYLTPPDGNSKLLKGSASGWQTLSLSLAPADMSGIDVCPCSTEECRMSCIGHSAGNAKRFKTVIDSRIARTRFLFKYPEEAMGIIKHELESWVHKSRKRAVRLNTFSDIAWEVLNPGLLVHAQHLGYRVYDYTKIAARVLRPFKGYDLTMSYSGHNWAECESVLRLGGRVSMVFAGWFPKQYAGYPVIDGDEHDLRFLNPKNCIVGLKLKGVSPDKAGCFAVKEDTVAA
jgi:hypothetical protein